MFSPSPPDVVSRPPSESVYRAMVQQAKDALLLLDGLTIIDCNPSAQRLYGATCAQLRGQTLLDCSPPQQADGCDSIGMMHAYLEQAQMGIAQCFQWVHSRPDGSQWIAEIALTRWVDGNLERIIGVVRDISERQQLVRDLNEKKMKMQALLESFPGGVTMVDNSLRFIGWNKEMIRLTGFAEDFFQQDTTPSLVDVFRINIARGDYGDQGGLSPEEHLRMLTERALLFQPHRFERVRPDGIVLEIRGAPMINGGFVTTYHDITERHQLKERLHKQSLLLHEVLENMPAGITVFDENLDLQLWNSAVIEMLDLPPDCMVKGGAFEDLLRIMVKSGEYGEVDVEQEVENRMSYASRFKEHHYEHTTPNGRTFLIHGKPLYSDDAEGKMLEFITTLTDITDRKQAELAEHEANLHLEKLVKELSEARADLSRSERLAALGALVAGMAHELNTPLGNCLMMISGMQEMTGTLSSGLATGRVTRDELNAYLSEAAEASSLILRNLSTAANLVQNFKQLAAHEIGAQRRSFNLLQICGEVVSSLQKSIDQPGHMITLSIAPDIELDSYPGPFEQVIVNFIDNALLHAFGDTTITNGKMHLSATIGQPGHVVIEFHDNGVGIPAENLNRIFDPFFTTKLGRGSSGLGLNVSYNIITTLLGGQISVVSTLGSSTTFTVDLPLKAPLFIRQS